MEVHLTPELEQRLNDLAIVTGRSADELVHDAVTGLVDELTANRSLLDRRYEEIISGTVEPIPGPEVFARLREKSATRRAISGT